MAKVLGITGGIGSGKSTVAKILSEILDSPVLDADKISKQAFTSPKIVEKIREFFGPVIFDSPNLINREQLSNIVFSNEKKLLELNKIVHPYVMNEISKSIDELAQKYNVILIDVPLPNKEFISLSDKIIVVVANEDIRIKRVMDRLKISEESVKKRISKQMPTENYIKLADLVIKNNDSIDELKANLLDFCQKENLLKLS